MSQDSAPDATPDEASGDDVSADLAELAVAHGVDVGYHDWKGAWHTVGHDTVVAVLAAMGVPADTGAAVRDSLAAHRDGAWTTVLPPYVVGRTGTATRVRVHVPHGAPLTVTAVTEDGREVTATHLPHDVEPHTVAGRRYGEALVEVPPLAAGYHRLVALVGAVPGGDGDCHSDRGTPDGGTPDGGGPGGGGPGGGTPDGSRAAAETLLVVAPDRLPPTPGGRGWGLQTQLYSVRSAGSWGTGDLADLAELAVWTARRHGAGFLLVNPLLANAPTPPVEDSPYLPATRRATSPLYLRPEDVPEAAAVSPGDRRKLDALRARAAAPSPDGLLDRDRAWTAKQAALSLVAAVPRTPARELEFAAFRRAGGTALSDFAVWSALTEVHGADWRDWPEQLRDPRSDAVADAARELADRVGFHAWLQWQADAQLAAADRRAGAAGMALGVVHDLPIGVAPHGADAWAMQDVLATGVSVGAPADAFNQQGQDWSAPPLRPDRLAATGFAAYREQLRHVLAHAGGLRIDHVLGLFRLWWVPAGALPSAGTYVRYDHEAMLAVLLLEASRAGAAVVGEDLGNVEPWVREVLTDRGVLGTSVLWFERTGDGDPKPPGDWRPLALGSVTVHDLPPTAGYLVGTHIELRERLGLLTRPVAEERAEDEADRDRWLRALEREGLLAPGERDVPTVVAALHRYVTRTPSRLVAVALTDAVGDTATQNQPGTSTEYPNWRLPLAGPDGTRLLLAEVEADPGVAALLDTVADGVRPDPAAPGPGDSVSA